MKEEKKENGGRRPYIFNWTEIDNLLAAGCKGTEVAAYLGVHHDTLYDRVTNEKGMPFSEYSAKLRSKGDGLLKAQQFAKALGKSKDGDNMMLIWLGKNRLGQSDNVLSDKPPNDGQIDKDISIAKLRAENEILRQHVNVTETGIEPLPSDEEDQHLVRSGEVGEDPQ